MCVLIQSEVRLEKPWCAGRSRYSRLTNNIEILAASHSCGISLSRPRSVVKVSCKLFRRAFLFKISVQTLERQTLERQTLERQTLERQTLERRMLERRMLERQTLERQTLERQTLERQTLERQTLERQTLERQTLGMLR
ncbi:hypothetical protein FHG87_012553 [Trinorchestia longiramus]|nr:hypothetical protein FHG87_012553 [Trinorchestia longiramus]